MLGDMMRSTAPAGWIGALEAMKQRRDQTDLLPSISVPTLVVVGEGDEQAFRLDGDDAVLDDAAPGPDTTAGAGHDLTSIRCSDKQTCLLTTTKGDILLRTTDGGQTATEITPSSQPNSKANPSNAKTSRAGKSMASSTGNSTNPPSPSPTTPSPTTSIPLPSNK